MTPEEHVQITRIRDVVTTYPQEFPDYAVLLKAMDERVTELLDANSRLTEERDAAKKEAEHQKGAVDFLLRHNGMGTMRRLEAENQILTRERDDAVHKFRTAQAQADMYTERAAQAARDVSIVEAARKWAQSIHALRRAQKPSSSGGTGKVLEANQAYTATHLALLALMPDTSDK